MSEKNLDICPLCEKLEVVDIKENFGKDPDVIAIVEKEMKKREVFIREMLDKHLSDEDKKLFAEYEKLADYFSDKVNILIKNDSNEDGYYGVVIYGKKYLKNIKNDEFI